LRSAPERRRFPPWSSPKRLTLIGSPSMPVLELGFRYRRMSASMTRGPTNAAS